MIDRGTFQRVREIFEMTCELSTESRREILARECDGNTELQAEVESLLRHHDVENRRVAAPTQDDQLDAQRPTPPTKSSWATRTLAGTTLRAIVPRFTVFLDSIDSRGRTALWTILTLIVLSGFVSWAYIHMERELRQIRTDQLEVFLAEGLVAIENLFELEKTRLRFLVEHPAYCRCDQRRQSRHRLAADCRGFAAWCAGIRILRQ